MHLCKLQNGAFLCIFAHFASFWAFLCFFLLRRWPAEKPTFAQKREKLQKKGVHAIPPLFVPPVCVPLRKWGFDRSHPHWSQLCLGQTRRGGSFWNGSVVPSSMAWVILCGESNGATHVIMGVRNSEEAYECCVSVCLLEPPKPRNNKVTEK